MTVWQAVDSYGECEDCDEFAMEGLARPVFAGLCLGRHRDGQTAIEPSNERSSHNGTFLRRVGVHLARREVNGCSSFL